MKQDFRFAPAMLFRNGSLLALPVISGLLTLVVTALVGLAVLPSLEATIDAEATGASISWADIAILLVAYFVIAIIATILNAAVVAAALELVRGGKPTVGGAISMALARALPLAGWGLINATVGLVLSAIRRNSSGGAAGIVTSILGFLLSAAWGILTFFTVPVILMEGAGPIGGIRRSGSLMGATFQGLDRWRGALRARVQPAGRQHRGRRAAACTWRGADRRGRGAQRRGRSDRAGGALLLRGRAQGARGLPARRRPGSVRPGVLTHVPGSSGVASSSGNSSRTTSKALDRAASANVSSASAQSAKGRSIRSRKPDPWSSHPEPRV
jgi:hypothetical protein